MSIRFFFVIALLLFYKVFRSQFPNVDYTLTLNNYLVYSRFSETKFIYTKIIKI